jgi:hypothetical protein
VCKQTLLRISRKFLLFHVRLTFITVKGNLCYERCIAVPGTRDHFPISLYLPVLASKRKCLIITHRSYFILCTMLFTNSFLAFFVAVFLLVGFVCYIYLRLFSRGPLPDVLPWVGVNDNGGFFSHARATLKSVTNTRELLQEGYYKVIPSKLPNTSTYIKELTKASF